MKIQVYKKKAVMLLVAISAAATAIPVIAMSPFLTERILWKLISAEAVSFAIICISITAVSAGLLKPLHIISSRMNEIAHGKGDLRTRIELDRKDELGVIASDFNTFAAQLGKCIGKIHTASARLSDLGCDLHSGFEETAASVK